MTALYDHCLCIIFGVMVCLLCLCPVKALRAVELAQSISWQDGIESDLNDVLLLLGLVLQMVVVSVNCSLGFFVSFLVVVLCFASSSQVIG